MFSFEDIVITYIEPCMADASQIRFKARIVGDISDLMPYLNAVLPDGVYNPEASNLVFKKGLRLITLYGSRLTATQALNETDAYQVVDEIKELIARVHRDRDQIQPIFIARVRVSPLQVYKCLPEKNCRQCGELTCLAFATKLVRGELDLFLCKPLFKPENVNYRQEMAPIVGPLGYVLDNGNKDVIL